MLHQKYLVYTGKILQQRHRYRKHHQRKGSHNRKLTKWEQQGNRKRSKIRSRVEHIFGVQAQRAGNLILREISIVRSGAKIGLYKEVVPIFRPKQHLF